MINILNNCQIGGTLLNDPVLNELSNNVTVCNFTLAVVNVRKTRENTLVRDFSYIECEVWDSGAKVVASTYIKGDKILVNATLKTDKWHAKDGTPRQKLKLRVNQFMRLDNSKSTEPIDNTNDHNIEA